MSTIAKTPVCLLLAGGGPASGINSVIDAVKLGAAKRGWIACGAIDGWSSIIGGQLRAVDLSHWRYDSIRDRGGCAIGMGRDNPKGHEDTVIKVLTGANVKVVVTIGGDDTLTSSKRVVEKAGDAFVFVHVPKTIDNNLPLPEGFNTFGFATASEEGARVVETYIEEARTTGDRYFIVVTQGREEGFLGLAIGTSTNSLTIIPEEVPEGGIPMTLLLDILAGAIIKNFALALDSDDLVHARGFCPLVAEGIFEKLSGDGLKPFIPPDQLLLDKHGHLRMSKIPLAQILTKAVETRLDELGFFRVVRANERKFDLFGRPLGFRLRCCAPCQADIDYGQRLGNAAVEYGIDRFHQRSASPHGMVSPSTDGTIQVLPFAGLFGPDGKPFTRRVSPAGNPGFKRLLSK